MYHLTNGSNTIGEFGLHIQKTFLRSNVWSFTIHPVGINESHEISFSVSPNPANDMVQLQMNRVESGDINVEFYNSLGTKVSSRKLSNKNSNSVINVDVSDLKSGVYMMTIEVNNNQSTQRLIIR